MNPPATPEKPDRPATSATPETPILTHPGFRLLWASGTISGLGSWLLVVALPFRVFQLTGSPAATGLTLALESLPALLIGPWAARCSTAGTWPARCGRPTWRAPRPSR